MFNKLFSQGQAVNNHSLEGYRLFSIVVHWLGAAALIFMFITGERMEDAERAMRRELRMDHVFWYYYYYAFFGV